MPYLLSFAAGAMMYVVVEELMITCEQDGSQVIVRTSPLTDASGKRITQDAFEGKTIDVRGVVGVHHGIYEIKVLSAKDITVI